MARKIVTVKSVTDAELQLLQNAAGAAGDIEMAAIAELARVGKFDGDDWALDRTERRLVEAMTPHEALKLCVKAINDARGREYDYD